MFTMEELQDIMTEYGIVLRVIPRKTRSIFEPCHKDQYPDGRIERCEGFDREMLVVERVPEHAGKVMVEQVRSTSSMVHFTNRYFDTIEEAVEAVVKGQLHEIHYRERKSAAGCGMQ